MAHSPPEGRHAVPWSDEAADWPDNVAENARQISSFLTNGWPTGVKAPLRVVSGLSQATCEPEPCGSSATASAALALRQSSSPSSAESGDMAFGVTDAVVLGSSLTSEVIGKDMLQAAAPSAITHANANRKASRPAAPGL